MKGNPKTNFYDDVLVSWLNNRFMEKMFSFYLFFGVKNSDQLPYVSHYPQQESCRFEFNFFFVLSFSLGRFFRYSQQLHKRFVANTVSIVFSSTSAFAVAVAPALFLDIKMCQNHSTIEKLGRGQ